MSIHIEASRNTPEGELYFKCKVADESAAVLKATLLFAVDGAEQVLVWFYGIGNVPMVFHDEFEVDKWSKVHLRGVR